ncbi:hypothetical protein Tco_1077923 [Tanacetum coccineum]
MHERPARKIGLYTRFFDFANFRLPLSTFLVHFEILCRVYGITATVGLFRCFYVNSKKNGWMSFIKRSDKSPVSAGFNAQDYATIVAHPSPFRKFPEEFMCLVRLSRHYTLDEETYPRFLDKDGEDMDIFAFIYTPDPTKVKIVMRERREDKPQLLDTTVGRTVPLLPVAPDCAEGELESSVDKLFDECSSGNQAEQGDFAEVVFLAQPIRQKKRKTIVADVGGPSHPPKKLKEDHGTPSGASVGGKSRSAVQ